MTIVTSPFDKDESFRRTSPVLAVVEEILGPEKLVQTPSKKKKLNISTLLFSWDV